MRLGMLVRSQPGAVFIVPYKASVTFTTQESIMRTLAKTIGWLIVSGLIIFVSNLASGVTWDVALIGAAIGKIGTTIAYFFYESGVEKYFPKKSETVSQVSQQNCNAEVNIDDWLDSVTLVDQLMTQPKIS